MSASSVSILGLISGRVCDQGSSLSAAAIQSQVTRRDLVSWVRLADETREPFTRWLSGMLRSDARQRAEVITKLMIRASKDNRRGALAARDLERLRGSPTALEQELRLLRKEGRTRQARLDARKLERQLEAEGDLEPKKA